MGRAKINNQKWGGAQKKTEQLTFLISRAGRPNKSGPKVRHFEMAFFCPTNDPTNPARRSDILKWCFCCSKNDQQLAKRPNMLKMHPFHSIPLHCIPSTPFHCTPLQCIPSIHRLHSTPLKSTPFNTVRLVASTIRRARKRSF